MRSYRHIMIQQREQKSALLKVAVTIAVIKLICITRWLTEIDFIIAHMMI